jgi:hypothetical protein
MPGGFDQGGRVPVVPSVDITEVQHFLDRHVLEA